MKRVLLATVIASAFAASAPAVFAQAANPSTDVVAAQGATEAPGVQRQAQPEQRRFRLPSERVEARIAYLRTALKITSAQQAQFDNFANVLRTQARDMDKRMQERRAEFAQRGQGQQRPNVDAIARLERTQARMQERSARLGQMIAAAKPLYATFSPEQKQIADEMLAKGGRGGYGGQHRHGMHRPQA